MGRMVREALRAGVLVVGCAALAAADAQGYPSRAITVLSTTTAGTSGDIAIRLAVPAVSQALGQPIVVENRPAAGGRVAANAVKSAVPDGHTLLFMNAGHILVFHTALSPGYHAVNDFTAVTKVISVPSVIGVSASLPVNSMKDLLEYAGRNPKKVAYGSTGVGTVHHLLVESMSRDHGIELLHVPYSNVNISVPVADLATGRIQLFAPAYSSFAAVKPGTIRILAVVDRVRLKRLPDVPTVYEALPKHTMLPSLFGMLGPAGMSRAIAGRLQSELRTALRSPELVAKIEEFGANPVGSSPEDWGGELREATENVGRIVQQLNIARQ